MEQALKVSRCADDSGRGHRKYYETAHTLCSMHYAHSFKADVTNVSFLHNRMNEFDLHDLKISGVS